MLPNLKIIHLATTAVPLNRQQNRLEWMLNCVLSVPLEKASRKQKALNKDGKKKLLEDLLTAYRYFELSVLLTRC